MNFLDRMTSMSAITRAVEATNQANYGHAQEILDEILKNPLNIQFGQAVVLQFSLLEKELRAGFIDKEKHSAITLEKINAIQSKNLGNEELNDYLKGKRSDLIFP